MNIYGHATYVGNTGYNGHAKGFFRAINKYCNLKLRNYTVGPDWKGLQEENCHGKDVTEEDKNIICMQTLWNASGKLQDFPIFKKDISSFRYDVNLILSEANHYYFYDPYAGPKVAYTVWETTEYFKPFFEKLKEYDQVWVPTKWQADITIKQGMDPSKVKVVPEGVDSSVFFPEDYKLKDDKFTFMVFGRWDNRKSTQEIIRAFKNVFGDNDKVQLFLSVEDKFNADGLGSTKNRLKHYNLESPNIIPLEFLKREEYVNLLKAGHVFLSCSRSEGWNLPLIEAMACGTPSIYSDCSGQLEFAQGAGIPVKIKGEIPCRVFYKPEEICQGNWYNPDFKDLEEKILEVYNNYQYYKQKALQDSERIRNTFSWDNAAKTAIKYLEELKDDQIELLKKSSPESFEEIFDYNTYEHFCEVEEGDSVLDLGCSKGFFYFKHKNKKINYYGVDASPECLKDFYSILKPQDNPVLINAMVDGDKTVKLMKPFFHDTEEKMVSTLSFPNLMKLMPGKINFLKFDIEGGEKEIFENEEGYRTFKEKVEKFSGEIHLKGGSISSQQALDIVKKLQNDPDIYVKIFSCDGFHIDFYFWSNPLRYNQIIVSGIVKKNSRHESFNFKPSSVNYDGVYHIINESPSLGDIIAWVPMVDRFQKEKGAVVNLYTPNAELFQSTYPNINFDYYNNKPNLGPNVIQLGTYDIGDKKWSEFNLQELAAKLLNIEYVPTRCKIATPNQPRRNFKKKYVCIATQSTAQFKYWNNPDGWVKTVDYLKSLGYDVVCIDKYPCYGVDGSMNSIPNNAINKTGELPLSDRITDLMYCDFFIGLTSGLSWLAWSLGKPVVFISGISLPRTDFYTPYRVTNTNPNICHGCASEPGFVFDKYDWLFCPKKKNFECTREISFEMVKEKIDLLMVREGVEEDFSLVDATVSFLGSPKIQINEDKYKRYLVQLYTCYKGEWVIHFEDGNFPPKSWYQAFDTKRQKWRFKVFAFDGDSLRLLMQETYDEKGKNIEFIFDSEGSKYEIEYMKKAIAFEEQNKCTVHIRSKYHEILRNHFPNFKNIHKFEDSIPNIYASFKITRHEIESKRKDMWYTNKIWIEKARSDISYDHHENWTEYTQDYVFDDIINYE